MTWEDIFKQISEISDLQNSLMTKLDNPMLKTIMDRNKKYGNQELDLKTLNNALLEHKIEITPYQIVIFRKLNELELPKTISLVYQQMPVDLENAKKYVLDLVEKYNLVINCADLVLMLEKLTEVEYPAEFIENEYTKKVATENKIFIDYMKGKLQSNEIETSLFKFYEQYANSLPENQMKELLLQTFCLSYSKNTFAFFNFFQVASQLSKNLPQKRMLMGISNYQKIVKNCEIRFLNKMSLEQIYEKFKLIFETDLVKQNINKK